MGYYTVEQELELSIEHGSILEQAQLDYMSSLAHIPSVAYQIRSLLLSMLNGELKEIKRYILHFQIADEIIPFTRPHFKNETDDTKAAFLGLIEEILATSKKNFPSFVSKIRFSANFISQFNKEFNALRDWSNLSKSSETFDIETNTDLLKQVQSFGLNELSLRRISKRAIKANDNIGVSVSNLYELGHSMLNLWLAKSRNNPLQSEFHAAAREGITVAAYKYNPRSGVAFRSMAEPWVRYYIEKTRLEVSSPIHMSDKAARNLAKYNKISKKLIQEGDESLKALAAKMDMTLDEVDKVRTMSSMDVVDIDEPYLSLENEGHVVEDSAYLSESSKILKDAMSKMSERSAYVINVRQNSNITLEELGRHLNVCKERARQIETEAYSEFRKLLNADYGINQISDIL